jgi:hypothetical protein
MGIELSFGAKRELENPPEAVGMTATAIGDARFRRNAA